MSDLQDVIASSSVHAFNNGLNAGRAEERRRILEIIKGQKDTWTKPASFNYLKELDNLIAEIEKQS